MDRVDMGFKALYNRIDDVYQQVQADFDIAEKSKKLEENETIVGSLVLIFVTAAVIAIIYTPLRWYWVLLGLLILIKWLTSRIKKWDLYYVDVFLERLEEEKQEDPSLFVYTLRQWVRDLPKNDRARTHLESITDEMTGVDVPPPLPSPDTTEIIASAEETGASAANQEREEDEYEYEDEYKDEDKDEESCPKCGSDWIRAEEKQPGKIIYTCENCGKKWKPRKR